LSTALQSDIEELLAQLTRIRSHNRADCPDCKRFRAVSFDEAKRVYHCHGAGCAFSGGIATLRQRLGIRREWLPRSGYLRQQQERERAQVAAERLAAAVNRHRMELLTILRELNRREALARDAVPDHPAAWGALALVYRERPNVLAELAILENYRALELVRFFVANNGARQEAIARVIAAGGLWQKRQMECWHCVVSVPLKERQPGRCVQVNPIKGTCWRGCSGTCLVCKGTGRVLCDVLIETAV
jgi:hypothetical protein